MKVSGFIARNKDGELKMFRTFPLREPETYEAYDNYGDGCMDYVYHPLTRWNACGGDYGITLPMNMFGELKWEDDPIAVEFSISVIGQ